MMGEIATHIVKEDREYVAACVHAIENTAQRLGVDPVAFAEACQDGTWLEIAITNMQVSREMIAEQKKQWRGDLRWQRACSDALARTDVWLDKLDALKRVETET